MGRQPAVDEAMIGIDLDGFFLLSVSLPLTCCAALPRGSVCTEVDYRIVCD